MLNQTIAIFSATALLALSTLSPALPVEYHELASKEISLNGRVPGGGYVSDVMSDNIRLTLAYLNSENIDPRNINWEDIRKDRIIEFKLDPKEVFAFHEDYSEIYKGRVTKTTYARFNFDQGFKTDGYLYGDGVCHLASLINWAAKDAGLNVEAPVSHDFATISGIDPKYGTSIFFLPGNLSANSRQNLYVENSLEKPVIFQIVTRGSTLKVRLLSE